MNTRGKLRPVCLGIASPQKSPTTSARTRSVPADAKGARECYVVDIPALFRGHADERLRWEPTILQELLAASQAPRLGYRGHAPRGGHARDGQPQTVHGQSFHAI